MSEENTETRANLKALMDALVLEPAPPSPPRQPAPTPAPTPVVATPEPPPTPETPPVVETPEPETPPVVEAPEPEPETPPAVETGIGAELSPVFSEQGFPGTRTGVSQEDLEPLADAIVNASNNTVSIDSKTANPNPLEVNTYTSDLESEKNFGHRIWLQTVMPFWNSYGYNTDSDVVDDQGNEVPLPGHPYGALRRAGRGMLEGVTATLAGGAGFQNTPVSALAAERYQRLDRDLFFNMNKQIEASVNPGQDFVEMFDYTGYQLQAVSPLRKAFSQGVAATRGGSSDIRSPGELDRLKNNFITSSIQENTYGRMQELVEFLFDPTSRPESFSSGKNFGFVKNSMRQRGVSFEEGRAANALPIETVEDLGFAPLIFVRAYQGSPRDVPSGYYQARVGQAGQNPSGRAWQRRIEGLGYDYNRRGGHFRHIDGGSQGFGGVRHGLQGAPANVVYSYIGIPARGGMRRDGVRSVYTNSFFIEADQSEGKVQEALQKMVDIFQTTQPEFNDASRREYISALQIQEENKSTPKDKPTHEILTRRGSSGERPLRNEQGVVDRNLFGQGPSSLVEGWFMPFKEQVTSITNKLSPAEILQLQTSLSRISQAGREASVLLGQNMQGQSPYNQRAHRAQIDALLWDSYTLQHFGDIIASEYKYGGTRALEY